MRRIVFIGICVALSLAVMGPARAEDLQGRSCTTVVLGIEDTCAGFFAQPNFGCVSTPTSDFTDCAPYLANLLASGSRTLPAFGEFSVTASICLYDEASGGCDRTGLAGPFTCSWGPPAMGCSVDHELVSFVAEGPATVISPCNYEVSITAETTTSIAGLLPTTASVTGSQTGKVFPLRGAWCLF